MLFLYNGNRPTFWFKKILLKFINSLGSVGGTIIKLLKNIILIIISPFLVSFLLIESYLKGLALI